MKRTIILLSVLAVSGFIIIQLILHKRRARDLWPERLTIATVSTGIFIEYIPATGVVVRDSITDDFFVTTEIDEFYQSQILIGRKATTVLDTKELNLVVFSINPKITPQGRFTITLSSDSLHLLEGKTLRLRIELSEPRVALLLAVGSFYMDTGGEWVYVVEGDKAVKRAVKLGRKNTENFEVLEGLKAGDRVITSSYENFMDPDSILLKDIASE